MHNKQNNSILHHMDFLSKKNIAGIIFIIFVSIGMIAYFKTGFILGTDFSGGIRIEFSAPTKIENIREILNSEQIAITTLKNKSGEETFLLTAPADLAKDGSGEYLLDSIKKSYREDKITILSSDFIGPTVGIDFTYQALKLLSIVTLLMLIYIAFRFDFLYGIGAISALLHDMIIMLVATLMFKIPIDLTILAAFLTILGYSINDTIVIFDRVRENYEKFPNNDFAMIINKSIGQTVKRTILTSLTTLFVAISIYIWAGSTLEDFGLLLIVGIISGTYSSIFIASPVTYIAWKKMQAYKNR